MIWREVVNTSNFISQAANFSKFPSLLPCFLFSTKVCEEVFFPSVRFLQVSTLKKVKASKIRFKSSASHVNPHLKNCTSSQLFHRSSFYRFGSESQVANTHQQLGHRQDASNPKAKQLITYFYSCPWNVNFEKCVDNLLKTFSPNFPVFKKLILQVFAKRCWVALFVWGQGKGNGFSGVSRSAAAGSRPPHVWWARGGSQRKAPQEPGDGISHARNPGPEEREFFGKKYAPSRTGGRQVSIFSWPKKVPCFTVLVNLLPVPLDFIFGGYQRGTPWVPRTFSFAWKSFSER